MFQPYIGMPIGDDARFTGYGSGTAGIVFGHETKRDVFRVGYNLGAETQPEGQLRTGVVLVRYMAGMGAQLFEEVLGLGVEFAGASATNGAGSQSSLLGTVKLEVDHIITKFSMGSDLTGYLMGSPLRAQFVIGLVY